MVNMLRCLLKHCDTKKYDKSEGTSSCILTVGTNMKLETSAKYQPPNNRVGMTLDGKAPEPPVIRGWQCPKTPVNHRMAVPWSSQKPQNGTARAPGIHRRSAPQPPVSTDAVLQIQRYPQMQCSRAPGIHRRSAPEPRYLQTQCSRAPGIHRRSAPEPPVSTDTEPWSPQKPRDGRALQPVEKRKLSAHTRNQTLFSGPQITGCTNK
jgi:hypothetical protein